MFKKKNYRPLRILTNISKIYKRLIYNQLSSRVRKCFSSQYYILVMMENFKEAIHRGNQFGTLLTILLKAFDSVAYQLLIAKVNEYNVSSSALNIISYLKHRTQGTKSNDCFSAKSNVECDVSPESVHYILILISLTDKENDIANYADDTNHFLVLVTFSLLPTNYRLSQQKFFISLAIIMPIQFNVAYYLVVKLNTKNI